MTTSAKHPARTTGSRPPLLTRPLLLRFVSLVGATVSFFLLLSVVPAYAAGSGGGGAAGLATGALMLSTVLGELVTPRLVARFGYRVVLIAGLFLLGAPALALTASRDIVWIVAVCLVRGLGFALTIVAGGALTATLIPAERRGEGLAVVGVVSGVPSLVALPLGLWLAEHAGYGTVAAVGGGAALAAIVSVFGLPDRGASAERPVGVVRGLRTGALLRPVLVFGATATAAGILVTFLPLAAGSASSSVIAAALFAQPAAATVTRWLAGRHGRPARQRRSRPARPAPVGGGRAAHRRDRRSGRRRRGIGAVRGRLRHRPERHPDPDVRPGVRLFVRHGQRTVESRLRRWHGRRCGGLRCPRGGDRLSVGVRGDGRTDADRAGPGAARSPSH
ncbi:MFS family permease [Streptomyces canus]|nr:MFS transporter [Streptomyces canus]MDQ0598714.1 MFS family permease [Streptomyces canus]